MSDLIITPDIIRSTNYVETTRGLTLTRYFFVENLPSINPISNILLQIRDLSDPNGKHIPYLFDQHPSPIGKNLFVTNVKAEPFPANSKCSALVTVIYQERYVSNFGLPSHGTSTDTNFTFNGKLTISSTSNQQAIIINPDNQAPLYVFYQNPDGSIQDHEFIQMNILRPGLIFEYDFIKAGSILSSDFIGANPGQNKLPDNLLNSDDGIWKTAAFPGLGKQTLLLRNISGEALDAQRDNTGYWWHVKILLEYRPYPGWLEYAFWTSADSGLPPPDIDTSTITRRGQNDSYIGGDGWVAYVPYQTYPFATLLQSINCFNPFDTKI